jgi:hypothetical protein
MIIPKRGYVLAVIVLCVFLIVPGVMYGLDVIAYIGETGGEVTVLRGTPGKELAAEPGMLLEAGDTVKTDADSYSSIIFQDDGSRIKLGENSQLTLNATREKKKLKKRMFLDSGGKLWAKVNRQKGTDLQIKTPTSVASVKGTKFGLQTFDAEDWVWVYEDAVQVDGEAGTVTVEEGEFCRVTRESIEKSDIEEAELPTEPGKHKLIIFFEQEDGVIQKELHIHYGK